MTKLSKNNILVIVGVLFLLLLISGVSLYFIFSPKSSKPQQRTSGGTSEGTSGGTKPSATNGLRRSPKENTSGTSGGGTFWFCPNKPSVNQSCASCAAAGSNWKGPYHSEKVCKQYRKNTDGPCVSYNPGTC